ncbi:MAG: electron transfer flavoprotein subunit alpha/FixB family protein [Candidatus Heimdallarchaeota archaeon]|nr:electron transfer flavoprotein subunit alpha/FixB family protein [Candidatus Heimdallarchaeota archaeon]
MSIAVFLESYNNKMVKAAAEAINAAKIIAEKTGKEMFGIALDENIDEILSQAGNYGISRVKGSSHITLYHSSMYARFIANAAREADIVIFPGTVWGREIAPQVTIKLDANPVSDIIGIEEGNVFRRSLHGNKIHSTVKADGKLVITVRPAVFDLPAETGGSAESEPITPETMDSDTLSKLAEILAASSDKVELTEADIIVSGGRGVGGPDNWPLIINLAEVLGAAHGASRAVVDAGWRPHSEQVGQTGKFVSPKVYIAVGISGAIQHLAGMSTSEIIVAVNKDEGAPIFKVADYGLVGDLFDVVPKLTEEISRLKQN